MRVNRNSPAFQHMQTLSDAASNQTGVNDLSRALQGESDSLQNKSVTSLDDFEEQLGYEDDLEELCEIEAVVEGANKAANLQREILGNKGDFSHVLAVIQERKKTLIELFPAAFATPSADVQRIQGAAESVYEQTQEERQEAFAVAKPGNVHTLMRIETIGRQNLPKEFHRFLTKDALEALSLQGEHTSNLIKVAPQKVTSRLVQVKDHHILIRSALTVKGSVDGRSSEVPVQTVVEFDVVDEKLKNYRERVVFPKAAAAA